MKTVWSIADVRAWRRAQKGRVGLVPTMGYLHEGHLSLVRAAREENDAVAASLFVNPTQFGPAEDLARYPRDLPRDEELLATAQCDLLFVPDAAEMYPAGFATVIDTGAVGDPLEGERRPGHFRGVATIVAKLFGIVGPTHAYFGQKDAQQLAVLRRMARDLDSPVEIRACPTVREADGLAMSSRNSYLSPEERKAAVVLYRALEAAKAEWQKGRRHADTLHTAMVAILMAQPLAQVDYAAVADPETFQEIKAGERRSVLLLLAVRIGKTRLIDNLLLEP